MPPTKVFGIGLGRTGTTTLGSALHRLGYKHCSFHYSLVYAYGRGEFDDILHYATRFDSFDDYPWPLMYERLDEAFPDALFILTRRQDASTWYKSLCRHAETRGSDTTRTIVYGHPRPAEAPDLFIDFYNSHLNAIRRYFSGRPDKFVELCWEEGDGWLQLCHFLNTPVPDQPFPFSNKTGSRPGEYFRYRLIRKYITPPLQHTRAFCRTRIPGFWRIDRHL